MLKIDIKQNTLRTLIVTSCLGLFSILTVQVRASVGLSQARALGMGDAYTCLASGVDAAYWNPANLSANSKKGVSINVLALGVFAKNNAFSKGDYDLYNGAFLDTDAKNHILKLIPDDGVTVHTAAGAQALSFSYGPFAFSNSVVVSGKSIMAKEIFNLLFLGNEVDRNYNFQVGSGEAVAYGAYALSYGHAFNTKISWLSQISFGVTAKYLRGYGFGKTIKMQANTLTDFHGTGFSGSALLHQATGGSGFGVDVGLAGTVANKYRMGLVIKNAPAFIRWSKGTEETAAEFRGDSLTVERLRDVDVDTVVTHSDSVYAIGSFTQKLPLILRLGVATQMGDFILAADYRQGFRETSLSDTTPQFAVGVEWRRLNFLRFRSGITVGGFTGFAMSWGLGLATGPVFWDIAFRTYNSPFARWAQGLAVGTNLQLRF